MGDTPPGDSLSVIRMSESVLREALRKMQRPMARMVERCKRDQCADHEAVRELRDVMELLGALQGDLAQAGARASGEGE